MTFLIAFLSLGLTIASLVVMHERRKRRGLQSLLGRVLDRENPPREKQSNRRHGDHRTDDAGRDRM